MTATPARARARFTDVFEFHWERLDLPIGVAGALLVMAPLALGYALGLSPVGRILAPLGALNLLFAAAPRPQGTSPVAMGVAVGSTAAAFGVGGLVAGLADPLEIALVGVIVTVVLLVARHPEWAGVGFVTAIMFVIATGLPPVDAVDAGLRAVAVFGGALFAYAGWMALHRVLPPLRAPLAPGPAPARAPIPLATALPHATVVGVTVAAGLAVGLALGFQRDYWIMLTILVALRAGLSSTASFAAARVAGTIVGASLAFGLTLFTSDLAILVPVLAVSAALTLASRAVNNTFYSVWVTLFIIGLVNLLYSGGPGFAVVRILDTLVGGGLAVGVALLLAATGRERLLVTPT